MTDAREAELLAENQALKDRLARMEALEKENALLRQKLDLLIRKLFGAQSEKLDPAQLLLLLQGVDEPPGKAPEPVVAEEPRRSTTASPPRERGPRLPEHLPVVEEVLDPAPVQACPQAWRCIGEEISEQLDYEPARFLRRRLIRRKYVRRGGVDAVPVIAPLPERLQERCLAAPGLLAQILIAKYCDHLPLYRQEQIYRTRHGVFLPRQSMARWVGLAADWLRPIYETMRTGVMAGGYVQVDETPIRYLEPGHGKTRQGYLWAYSRPGGDVLFDWQTSRAAACLDHVIAADFTGTLQCDGYSAYPAFAERRAGKVALAGCWAHARRKFHEALDQAPRTAGWIIRQIAHLYRIEKDLREKHAGPRLRAAVRTHQSRPLVARLHRALLRLKLSRRHLPQSLLGQAIDYTLSQWAMLSIYLGDGRIEIDNNLVENAIRPTAVGKKNWLFIGEAQAGQRGAILYTIIESCRRRGVDPHAYLRDVLTRLPQLTNWQIKNVTPEAWAKAQRPARQAA
jgi:transposase